MLQVHEKLYLGNALEAREPRQLYDLAIEAVVDVAFEESPASLPRDFIYCRLPLLDGEGNSTASLRSAFEITRALIGQRKKTLVSCSAGLSRSPTLACYVLSDLEAKSPEDVLASIGSVKGLDIKPSLWTDFRRLFEGPS